jgi:hypothetical protein
VATPNKTAEALRTGAVIVWAALAGCAIDFGSTAQPKASDNPATSTPAVAKLGDAARVPSSAGDLTGQSAGAVATGGVTTTATISPAKTNNDTQQLLGLAGTVVSLQLGVPSLIRRDGTAEIWQYRATACILDVFLYASGEEQLVRHVELRSRNAGNEPHQRCFAELLKAEKNRISG